MRKESGYTFIVNLLEGSRSPTLSGPPFGASLTVKYLRNVCSWNIRLLIRLLQLGIVAQFRLVHRGNYDADYDIPPLLSPKRWKQNISERGNRFEAAISSPLFLVIDGFEVTGLGHCILAFVQAMAHNVLPEVNVSNRVRFPKPCWLRKPTSE